MIVVSDASPIIALAAIGRLDLLPDLYGEVVVPIAVHEEITARPDGAALVAGRPWLSARAARDRDLVSRLEIELDRGEPEAIALAVELPADLLVIDDRRGRTVAAQRGVPLIGVVGVLIEARTRGLLDSVRPVLDDLAARAGFWLGNDVRRQALKAVGEASDAD